MFLPIVLQAAVISSLLLVAEGPTPAQTAPPTQGTGCTDRAIISCDLDASAQADLSSLQTMVRQQLLPFAGEGAQVEAPQVQFVGRARAADLSQEDSLAEGANYEGGRRSTTDENRRSRTWRIFNSATQNEFEVVLPGQTRDIIHRYVAQLGLDRPNRGRTGTPPGDAPEASPPVPTIAAGEGGGELPIQPASWSGGADSRVRKTPVDVWPWRTVADMGGCTGTFVGPRHVVTAGHCLYSRTNAAWGSSFTVRPQRDAGSVPYSTTVPDPSGRESWMFTPVGWRDSNPSGGAEQYDLGILVVPDRFGDQLGWMGYGTLGANDLKARTHLLRGYPFCESETGTSPNNPERIDEPNPPEGCVINGFYAGDPCTMASFTKPDPQGWSRRVTHGCDAGAANSGSALYSYMNPADPWVFSVHTKSLKCRFAGDAACTAADTHPLEATRLTPEYSGWISYFRNMFP